MVIEDSDPCRRKSMSAAANANKKKKKSVRMSVDFSYIPDEGEENEENAVPHPSKARISFPEDEDGPRRRLVSPMVDGGGGSTMAHQASLSEVDPEIVLAASIFVEELVERAAQEVN